MLFDTVFFLPSPVEPTRRREVHDTSNFDSVDTWALVHSLRDADCNLIFGASIESPCFPPANPPRFSPRIRTRLYDVAAIFVSTKPLEENCNVHLLEPLANHPHHRSPIAIPGARDACAPHQLGLPLLPGNGNYWEHADYMYMYMTLYFLLSSSSKSPYVLSVHANEGGAHCFLRGAVPAVLDVRNKDFAAQWQMEIALTDADFEAPPSMPRKNLVLFLLPGNLLFDANLKGCN
ncbi:hypothetical protein C8R44DRAFT_753986 [Mycena epipterygia]|nr:hypothetical protein C8R44DRAFT_753986 [Mycena epipterygia]